MIDFDKETAFNAKVLEAIAVRSRVAMHNLANQNVPGFKRYQVRFEEMLRAASEAGKDLHDVNPVVERDLSGAPGQNNVSAIVELASLDKTKMLHEIFARRAGAYFTKINKAIHGR